MRLVIRHYPERKKPAIVLEQGNRAVILGYLTDKRREKWLNTALDAKQAVFEFDCPWDLEQITER